MSTVRETKRDEAIQQLRKMIRLGDTVYTVIRHVSKSGMSRGIDVYLMHKNEPVWITSLVGNAIDCPQSMNDWKNQNGLRVSGCGMDMGFHLVYSLSRVLFPKGFIPVKAGVNRFGSRKLHGRNGTPDTELDTNGGYALNHKWL